MKGLGQKKIEKAYTRKRYVLDLFIGIRTFSTVIDTTFYIGY